MSAQPKLKFTYFDIEGLGEPIRLAMVLSGISFEDHRIQFKDWPALKPTMPSGKLPALVIDDEIVLSQSIAILNYVARIGGVLQPKDNLQTAFVDEIMMILSDIPVYMGKFLGVEIDPETNKALREDFVKNTLPKMFSTIDNLIERHGSKGFAVGESITIADLRIYGHLRHFRKGIMDHIPATVLDEYKNVNYIYDTVHNHPKVAEWRAARGQE